MKKILLIFLFISHLLYAQIAKVTAINGEVIIVRDSKDIIAQLGTLVEEEDHIKTDLTSRAQIVFRDNTIISIGKKSSFSVQEYLYEPKKPVKASFKFGSGVFKTITGKIGKINAKSFKLQTKTSSIGIRGTIVGIESTANSDIIIVPEGQVVIETPDGVINVNEGQMTEIKPGEKAEIKEIPKQTQDRIEENSGASKNEQESGQGEATQSNELTQKEKQEAKEQQSSEKKQAEEKESKEEKSEKTIKKKDSKEKKPTEKKESKEESSNQKTDDKGKQDSQDKSGSKKQSPTSSSDNKSQSEQRSPKSSNTQSSNEVQNSQSESNSIADDVVINENAKVEVDAVEVKEVVVDVGEVDDVVSNAQETVEETTQTQTQTPVTFATYTASLTGNSMSGEDILGTDVITSARNSFSIEGGGKFILKDSNSNTVATFTAASEFTLPNSGSYSGFSNHPSSVSYSPTINGSVASGQSYTVTYDNMAEFFVAYNNAGTVNLADYKDMFYSGIVSSVSNLSTSKILTYVDLVSLNIKTNPSGNIQTTVSEDFFIETNDINKMYINPQTKSVHFFDSDHKKNARNYNAGYLNSDGTFSLTNYQTDTKENSYSKMTSFSGALYGTDFQGIGATHSESTYDISDLATVTKKSDGMHTFKLDTTNTESVSTGSITYSGLTSYVYNGNINLGGSVNFTINQTTGDIEGSLSGDTITTSLSIDGNTSSGTSYYINSDTFGALFSSGGKVNNKTIVDNTAWMVSIPDDIDASGNSVYKLDNESSWGYWTAVYDSTKEVDYNSAWVAGVETAEATIDSLKSTSSTAHFDGHVIGSVINGGSIDPILIDTNNNVSFDFQFGADTFNNASISFKTEGNQVWTTNTFSGTINTNTGSYGFSSNLITGNITGSATDSFNTGAVNGKFYGTDSVKSVGGTFKLDSSNNGNAIGVFKAD